MKQIFATTCLLLAASPATALSCMQPDIAFSYQNAVEAAQTYAILLGQISYDQGSVTEDQMEAGVTVPGRFTGVQIGTNGQSAAFTRAIAVDIVCAGPWCGAVDTSPNTISFVEVTPDGFEIIGSPCPGAQFSGDDPDVLATLQACLRGDACGSQWSR